MNRPIFARLLFFCLGFLLLGSGLYAQTISNVRVTQDPELGYYKIYFDLSDNAEDLFLMQVTASNGNTRITNPPNMAGAGISTPIKAGKNLSIFWHPTLATYPKDGWQFTLNAAKLPKDMILVEGGSFQMGSNDGESDEKPVHQVTVSSFFIGKYEVTQKEWQEVMGSNPSYFKGDNFPVDEVSWYDALVYCNKRSVKEGLTPCYSISGSSDPNRWGSVPTSDNSTWNSVTCNWSANGYRLPTEAEWEYTARGGNKSKGYKYSGSNDPGSVAWYADNSGSKTHSVGGKQANELGIYDMSGNVWEWCWDWHDSSYYSKSESRDPRGSGSGSYRSLRGGSWDYYSNFCRVSYRNYGSPHYRYYYYYPHYRNNFVGVRVLRANL